MAEAEVATERTYTLTLTEKEAGLVLSLLGGLAFGSGVATGTNAIYVALWDAGVRSTHKYKGKANPELIEL